MREPRTTPLTDLHRAAGARLVPFAGYLMPLQYSGIVDEHRAVREAAGIFDVSHMGEVELTGPAALATADRLVTNDAAALDDGQALYTPMCYPHGGIVDDCLVYRKGPERVMIVVNAAGRARDVAWIRQHALPGCEVADLSDETALIAVQGPRAVEIVAGEAGQDVAALGSFHFREVTLAGARCLASRTGYTGEDGFEIYCAAGDAAAIWERLTDAGRGAGLKPCGLGARDTLRLEARLPLYGSDIDETTTPLEAGLGWTVKLRTGADFIGKAALAAQKKARPARRLACLEMRGRGIARHGHTIHEPAEDGGLGPRVGEVTSGTRSPTLGRAVALGYLPRALARAGTRLLVDVRGKPVPAEVVKGPFYQRAR